MRSRTALAVSFSAAIIIVIGAATTELRADTLETLIAGTVTANAERAKAQKNIDKLDDHTQDLLNEYRGAIDQLGSLQAYNNQVSTLVSAQNAEMESLQTQIGDATRIAREITPLMLKMVDVLAKFVALDVPFLPQERNKRVGRLREMMGRADVSDAEKYRRILEAYQIENEYGRTIETYRADLTVGDGSNRAVNFLRIGRTALIYQTLDEREARVWSQKDRGWHELPPTYRTAIKKGLRIARKQAAPDMIRIPVAAPEVAQ